VTEEPSRLRVIQGGAGQKESRRPEKRVRASGKRVSEQPFVCSACNETSLQRLRLGARDVNGKLRGGEDWWCCGGCRRAWYRIKSYD
jgi:hypothetical protein